MVGGAYGTPRVGLNFKWGGGGNRPITPPPLDVYGLYIGRDIEGLNIVLYLSINELKTITIPMWSLKIESNRFIGYWVLRLQTKTLLLYTKDNNLFLITQYLQKCKKVTPPFLSEYFYLHSKEMRQKKRIFSFYLFLWKIRIGVY